MTTTGPPAGCATSRHVTDSNLRHRTSSRRLDRSRDSAILDAALAAVTEHGYNATNMNDIASRAGVGKAAIYRRWSSKAALIVDALLCSRPECFYPDDVPDTGSLSGDLATLVEFAGRRTDIVGSDLMVRIALEATHDRSVAAAIDDMQLLGARGLVITILSRAVDRGEIPGTHDWTLIADILPAMSLNCAIQGKACDGNFTRRVIDAVLVPAVR